MKGKLIGSINDTVVGDVELVAGKKGLALHINGKDQYVEFSYQSNTCLGYFVLCICRPDVFFHIVVQIIFLHVSSHLLISCC